MSCEKHNYKFKRRKGRIYLFRCRVCGMPHMILGTYFWKGVIW